MFPAIVFLLCVAAIAWIAGNARPVRLARKARINASKGVL